MSKHPKKARHADLRRDWLNYLLDTLETAIEQDASLWDAVSANATRERTDEIAKRVREIAAKLEGA